MFCARCGHQIPDATVICPLCGRESNVQLQPSPAASGTGVPATAAAARHSPAYSGELRGVGGWLLLFCVLLTILTPLGNLLTFKANSSGRWDIYYLCIIVSSLAVGIQVWRVAPDALTWVKVYFIVFSAWEVLRIAYVVIVNHAGFDLPMVYRIRTLLWIAIWTAYFSKSKRVRATFGRNLFEQDPW